VILAASFGDYCVHGIGHSCCPSCCRGKLSMLSTLTVRCFFIECTYGFVVDGDAIHRWCVDAGDFEGGCSGQRVGTGEFAEYVSNELSGPFFIGGLFWQALLARRQTGDKRGITLVGYSVGARVVFSCLKELAILRYGDVGKRKSGNRQAASSSSVSEVYALFGLELYFCTQPTFDVQDADDMDDSESLLNEPVDADTQSVTDTQSTVSSSSPTGNAPARKKSMTSRIFGSGDKKNVDEEDILTQELDDEGKLYVDGLIQDVILLGAPVSSKV
jgi:hypothetical protein